MTLKNNLTLSLLFLSLIAGIFSCKKETESAVDVGYGYFPYEVGKYITYDVDSIVYDDFENDTDIYRFRIKEIVESIFTDNSGRPTMRIERYIKNYNPSLSYDSMNWVLKDVWSANITSRSAEKTEENIRYVKLSFPVTLNHSWNGNAFNTIGEQTYSYTDIATPRSYNSLTFDSTLMVTQENTTNLIEKKYYIEIFAKGVGLIYKESVDVYSGTIIPSVPVTSRIEKGFDYKMKVIDYGTE